MFQSTTSPTLFLAAATTLCSIAIAPVNGLPEPMVVPLLPPFFHGVPYHPVMQDNFADPAIITVDGVIYTFATASAGANVPIASNNTGSGWHVLQSSGKTQDAMPTLPAWSSGNIWAPDVVQLPNGTFVLYFSGALSGPKSNFHCIGAATSPTVTGPYTPISTPLACPTPSGGAIDPSGFTDTDSTPYVVYKVDGNSLSGPNNGPCGNANGAHSTPLMLQKLSGLDYTTPVGDPVQLLDRDANDGPLIEAPSLMRTGDGVYVLSFSSNCYNSALYDSSYATSTSGVGGPYTKTKTPLLLPGQHGLMSPGGLSFEKGGPGVVFHADKKYSDASVRQMYVMDFEAKGTVVTVQ